MKGIINYDKAYKLNRPITGVIHKDRIWEQWYRPEVFEVEFPKMNQCDYMIECNENYPTQTIINNRGKKYITVEEFYKMVDLYSKSLKANGVQVGDVIVTIPLSTPELVALKYACTKVGAITANLNFMENKELLYKRIKQVNPKMIFTLDIFEDKMSDLLNLPEFDSIQKVQLPLSKSTPMFDAERVKIKALQLKNNIKGNTIKKQKSFSRFIRDGLEYKYPVNSVYYSKMPANIAFTSGTTGDSKAILLSHDANNALALQHKLADLGLERGKKNLALVPPFLAFWDADIIHMAMCLGIENILELSLTYENIPKYLEKHLPNYGIWSQYLWDSVRHLDKKTIEKISKNMEKAVVGGERGEANQIRSFYDRTGILQMAGYGASEVDSCFSVAHPNCNLFGSAGLPLPFNNVRVVDDEMNDLTYNQNGRILITGPCMMNGYMNRDELTKEVFITDEDGIVWFDTKDYGHVDVTGSLVVLDRFKKPSKIIVGGNKSIEVNPIDVAEKVRISECVKMCKVDCYKNILVCHLVLEDPNSLNEVINDMRNNISEEEQPTFINVIDSFPRTSVGKVDYQELSKMTEEVVLANVDNLKENSKLNVVNNKIEGKKYEKHI